MHVPDGTCKFCMECNGVKSVKNKSIQDGGHSTLNVIMNNEFNTEKWQ